MLPAAPLAAAQVPASTVPPILALQSDSADIKWTIEWTKLLITSYATHKGKLLDINFKKKTVWKYIHDDTRKVVVQELFRLFCRYR